MLILGSLRGEGVVTVRRRVHDWVRDADKLVSGGVSLLDGAYGAVQVPPHTQTKYTTQKPKTLNCVLCVVVSWSGPLHNTKRNEPYSCLGVVVLCSGTTTQQHTIVDFPKAGISELAVAAAR